MNPQHALSGLGLAALVALLLATTGRAQTEPPDFNYADDDAPGYARAKDAFDYEYGKVIAYLQQTDPGGQWGFSDALGLWQYRESLRPKSAVADADGLFVVLRQMKTNALQDMLDNPEYYQIKLLLAVCDKAQNNPLWNPVGTNDRQQAEDELRNVIAALKTAGRSVEDVLADFRQTDRATRQKGLAVALDYTRWEQARRDRLIATRRAMYQQGLLPDKEQPKTRELKEEKLYNPQGILVERYTYYEEGGKRFTHGPYWQFYQDGKPRNYSEQRDGIGHGTVMSWHDNGRLFEVYAHREGKLHGLRSKHDRDGYLFEQTPYVDGKVTGVERKWYKGVPEYERTKVNDVAEGAWREYHKNGKLRRGGSYANGHRVGVWTSYDDEGKVRSTEEYDAEGQKRK